LSTINRSNTLKLHLLLPLLLLCLFYSPASATEISEAQFSEKQKLIEQWFDVAEINESIKTIPEVMQAQIIAEIDKVRTPNDTKEVTELYNNIVKKAATVFSAGEMRRSIQLAMHDSLNQSELRGVIDWYSSDLGKKIRAIERISRQPDFQAGLANYQTKYSGQEKSDRKVLIGDLMKLTGADEMVVTISTGISKSLILGMSSEVNHEIKQHLLKHSLQQDTHTKRLIPIFEARLTHWFAYMYEELSTQELTRFVDLQKETAAIKLNRSVLSGLNDVLHNGGYDLGASIGSYIMRAAELQE